MSNLVARLRGLYPIEPSNIIAVCDEAADEIERQAKRIEELEAERDFWKESRDFRVKEHLADKETIERLRAALSDIGFALSGLTIEHERALEIVMKTLREDE